MSGKDRNLVLLVAANTAILLTFMVYCSATNPGALEKFGPDTYHYVWISKTLYYGWEKMGSWSPYDYTDPGGMFAAFSHFPLYPIVVGAAAGTLLISRLSAGFLVSVLSANLTLVVFYKLALLHGRRSIFYPLLLIATSYEMTLQSILASYASLFLFLVFASVLFFERGSFGRSALFAGLAQATHLFGLTLFPAFVVMSVLKRRWRKAYLYLSVPFAILLIFTLYWFRSGNFWVCLKYHISHPYHYYFPLSTLYHFLSAETYSVWNRSLVAFSIVTIIAGGYMLIRAKQYSPAVLGFLSLLAAASIGPAHGFSRYSMPATICLLGFTSTDWDKRRLIWVGVILLCGIMYGYAFQAIMTNNPS